VTYRPQAIEILEPGMQTTVQDYPGRTGYWHVGVPPSGPMDMLAFRLANRLVGNPESAAALECTMAGPTLRFHADCLIAVTGAEIPAALDGQPMLHWKAIEVRAGSTLRLGTARHGARTYVSIRGGIDVPKYLGSRATFILGRFGGHAGRTLRAGDMLRWKSPADLSVPEELPEDVVPRYSSDWEIGVTYGPHGAPDFFTGEDIETLFSASWKVH
jgi:urea carboxylase